MVRPLDSRLRSEFSYADFSWLCFMLKALYTTELDKVITLKVRNTSDVLLSIGFLGTVLTYLMF